MNIWLVLIIGGLITFGMRLSLIYLSGRFEIPETMRRALHYVPPAVLSAFIVPSLLMPSGRIDISFDNIRLLAGLIAIVAAWFSRSTLVTILVGMAALFVIQSL